VRATFIKVARRIARRIVGRPILGRSILIYHRIAKADFDPWNIAVSPDEFERQLGKLRSKTVLPLREFTRLHSRNNLPRNSVAITFDDGYACNALVAAPMLEAFGYPATFFVVSDVVVRSEEFWWDQLEAIFHAPAFDYSRAMQLQKSGLANRLGNAGRDDEPFAAFLCLWRLARGLSTNDRRQYLDDLRDQIGMEKNTRATHRPMTSAELRTLAANPLFEIGGHTATHPCLPMLSPAEQEQDIVLGSRSLQVMLGTPIRSFAYPFGEWAPATREIIMAAGFDCAVTAEHRRVRAGDNQFELPRRQVVNSTARTQ
jgi:peptidoglycan/xylan/chitin deacetylase (PgdA/CDA1 family)